MQKHKPFTGNFSVAVVIFSLSMAMFEAAVVIYLRELYYPEGFTFPLKLTSNIIAVTEILRELASLFMIGTVAYLAGRGFTQRFAWFLIIFAIWDIFYYVFLKAILGWPESMMTWDILFLLPVHWTGPIIAPILISFIMIMWGSVLLKFNHLANAPATINKSEWWTLASGAFVVFIAFILDYSLFLIKHIGEFNQLSIADQLSQISKNYVPDNFYWSIFIAGTVLLLIPLGFYIKRNR